MKVAFTGESRLLDVRFATDFVTGILTLVEEEPTDVFTGGAYGIDTIAAIAAVHQWPEAHHRLIVPEGCDWNEQLPSILPGTVAVHRITGGYMKRNDVLIADATTLLAFPATATEQLRSGTWATIRRARQRELDVRIYPLTIN
jgi:hypothetical protein